MGCLGQVNSYRGGETAHSTSSEMLCRAGKQSFSANPISSEVGLMFRAGQEQSAPLQR
jgi:hypothetical protein